jgi:transposase
MVQALLAEREEQKRHAEELRTENLRLQLELERYKKYYYGPRADRLGNSDDLAQMLLEFSEALERKPVKPDDLPPHTKPEAELRRVTRRRGRRHLANFDHLPVTTRVYELSAEQRACPGCGVERKEAGAEESWQIEYLPGRFERIQHVRKKYACLAANPAGNIRR